MMVFWSIIIKNTEIEVKITIIHVLESARLSGVKLNFDVLDNPASPQRDDRPHNFRCNIKFKNITRMWLVF